MEHWLDYHRGMGQAPKKKLSATEQVKKHIQEELKKKKAKKSVPITTVVKKHVLDAYNKKVIDKANDPMQKIYNYAGTVHKLMVERNIPEPAATFAMYQSYFETEAFSNNGVKNYNNWSGIKFAGQKNAKKGPNGYAVFDSVADWANSFAYELRKGANPSAAKTLEDFVNRLKQNRYFEATVSDYYSGLKRARLVLRTLPAAEWNYDPTKNYNPETGISTDKPKESGKSDFFKDHPLVTGALLAVGGVLVMKALNN